MTTIRIDTRARSRPRLGVESLESRCACSAGFTGPPALPPPHPPIAGHFAPTDSPALLALPPRAFAPHVAIGTTQFTPKGSDRFQLVVAAGPHLTLRVGERFQGVVAHVEGVGPEQVAAHIDWGNGVRSEGLVRPVAGDVPGFDVIGDGRYDAAGTYAMTVQVMPPAGDPVVIGGLATVEPPDRMPSGYAPDYLPESAQTNSDPAPNTPPPAPAPVPSAVPERTPGDGDGGVPWERQPDPRPTDPVTGKPITTPTVELPPVHTEAEPAPANAPPAEPPAGPAYLAQAAREPVAAPVAAAVSPTPAVIDPRAAGGGVVEAVESLVPVGPPSLVQPPMIAVAEGAAVRIADVPPPAEVAPPTDAPTIPAKPKTERRAGVWRNGVAVGLALVFAERLLAARRGERCQRERGEPAAAGAAPHIPAGK